MVLHTYNLINTRESSLAWCCATLARCRKIPATAPSHRCADGPANIQGHTSSKLPPFSLYGSRHKWLDSLPPFDGSSNKPAQVTLQVLLQLQALLASGHVSTAMPTWCVWHSIWRNVWRRGFQDCYPEAVDIPTYWQDSTGA